MRTHGQIQNNTLCAECVERKIAKSTLHVYFSLQCGDPATCDFVQHSALPGLRLQSRDQPGISAGILNPPIEDGPILPASHTLKRIAFRALIALSAVLSAVPAHSQFAGDPVDPRLHSLIATSLHADVVAPKYVGPGSCSAVACHGGIQPRSVTKVLQNEYSTWVTEDKHARAFRVLTEPLAHQMSKTLKIGPADKAQKCLVCHALSVETAHRARDFDVAEGVSCESCHGPASAWLGPHIQPTARHSQMVALGLVDNKNLSVRSERCLSCHLGAPGLSVDHEMIAAGHPDLTFELDSFTAVEPPHWVEKAADQKEPLNDARFGVRAWGIGQAIQLRESMLRVARRAGDKAAPWPEFSEMDCMMCHHALTRPLSWRQKESYNGHRAGDPAYNLSRYVVFRHFADEVDQPLNHELRDQVSKVAALITTMSPDRAAVEAAANRAAQVADRMVVAVRDAKYDRARTDRLLHAIAADASAISQQGERSAEQATMTLDSLYIARAKDSGSNAETRAAIDGLFKLVNNPSAYNAPQFAAQMKKVETSLR